MQESHIDAPKRRCWVQSDYESERYGTVFVIAMDPVLVTHETPPYYLGGCI